MLPKGTAIVENTEDKVAVCNYGSYHYTLKKGERTPPLGMSIIDSFMARHPGLKIVESKESIEPEPILESSEESEEKPKKTRSKKGDK